VQVPPGGEGPNEDFCHEPFEGIEGQHGGDIDDGPRRSGDRNALEGGDVAAIELARAMDRQPWSSARVALGHGDVDGVGLVGEEAREVSGARVADRRAGTAGEDGGHLEGVRRWDGADEVDAAVQRAEPASRDSVIDRSWGETRRNELGAGNDAVPLRGDSGDHRVGALIQPDNSAIDGSGTFVAVLFPHIGVNPATELRAPFVVALSGAQAGVAAGSARPAKSATRSR
jgi:hypothetical protein